MDDAAVKELAAKRSRLVGELRHEPIHQGLVGLHVRHKVRAEPHRDRRTSFLICPMDLVRETILWRAIVLLAPSQVDSLELRCLLFG